MAYPKRPQSQRSERGPKKAPPRKAKRPSISKPPTHPSVAPTPGGKEREVNEDERYNPFNPPRTPSNSVPGRP